LPVYGWFIKGLESLPSNEVSIRLALSAWGRIDPFATCRGTAAIGAKRTAPVDVTRTLWIVAADAGTEGANVWVAEAFALEAKSVDTLDRPVHFRSRYS
jgi:hypothetical protein